MNIKTDMIPPGIQAFIDCQLTGEKDFKLDACIKNNKLSLDMVNAVAKKAITIVPAESSLLEREIERESIVDNLEKCVVSEKARLLETYGLILGSIAAIFSKLFGSIGVSNKIITAFDKANLPSFVSNQHPAINLEGLKEAKLEFEQSVENKTLDLEYKDL